MGFPFFFILFLAVIVLVIVAIEVYIQVYKGKINKKLQGSSMDQVTMVPPYKLAVILTIVLLMVSVVISYFVGYKTAYDRLESGTNQIDIYDQQTFYADIVEINSNNLRVQGIAENDINYRTEFLLPVYGETRLEWHGSVIEFSSLKEGDLIAITFIGEIQETTPATITDVVRIQLLEDTA